MSKCRHSRKLADYDVGLLQGQDAEQLERHLQQCEVCQAELAALRRTVELLKPMKLCDAPVETWQAIAPRLTPRRRLSPARQVKRWAPAFVAAMLILVLCWSFMPAVHDSAPFVGGADSESYTQVQLAAAWDNPLADKAALGLAMLATQETPQREVIN